MDEDQHEEGSPDVDEELDDRQALHEENGVLYVQDPLGGETLDALLVKGAELLEPGQADGEEHDSADDADHDPPEEEGDW